MASLHNYKNKIQSECADIYINILCVYTVDENTKPMNLGCKLKELTRDNEHPLTTVLHRLPVPLQYQTIYCSLPWRRALSLTVHKEVNCYLLLFHSIPIHKAIICPSPCHMWNSNSNTSFQDTVQWKSWCLKSVFPSPFLHYSGHRIRTTSIAIFKTQIMPENIVSFQFWISVTKKKKTTRENIWHFHSYSHQAHQIFLISEETGLKTAPCVLIWDGMTHKFKVTHWFWISKPNS